MEHNNKKRNQKKILLFDEKNSLKGKLIIDKHNSGFFRVKKKIS